MVNLSRHSERGHVTTEFVLVTPILVVAMLFLIGLGYTLMVKQNAVVGARVAVYYTAPREEVPSASDLTAWTQDAVSPGRENWIVDFTERNIENPEDPDASGTGVLRTLGNAVNAIYQSVNKEFSYTARGTATLGFLPRVMDLGHARGTYYLPRGSWTCQQTGGGSYLSITLSRMGLPSPLNSWLALTRCETYKASYR